MSNQQFTSDTLKRDCKSQNYRQMQAFAKLNKLRANVKKDALCDKIANFLEKRVPQKECDTLLKTQILETIYSNPDLMSNRSKSYYAKMKKSQLCDILSRVQQRSAEQLVPVRSRSPKDDMVGRRKLPAFLRDLKVKKAARAPKSPAARAPKSPAARVERKAPIARKPSPVARQPSPIARKPSPVVRQPSPVARQPSPIARKPSPVQPSPVRSISPLKNRLSQQSNSSLLFDSEDDYEYYNGSPMIVEIEGELSDYDIWE
jgi:hypothetical protein